LSILSTVQEERNEVPMTELIKAVDNIKEVNCSNMTNMKLKLKRLKLKVGFFYSAIYAVMPRPAALYNRLVFVSRDLTLAETSVVKS